MHLEKVVIQSCQVLCPSFESEEILRCIPAWTSLCSSGWTELGRQTLSRYMKVLKRVLLRARSWAWWCCTSKTKSYFPSKGSSRKFALWLTQLQVFRLFQTGQGFYPVLAVKKQIWPLSSIVRRTSVVVMICIAEIIRWQMAQRRRRSDPYFCRGSGIIKMIWALMPVTHLHHKTRVGHPWSHFLTSRCLSFGVPSDQMCQVAQAVWHYHWRQNEILDLSDGLKAKDWVRACLQQNPLIAVLCVHATAIDITGKLRDPVVRKMFVGAGMRLHPHQMLCHASYNVVVGIVTCLMKLRIVRWRSSSRPSARP